MSHAIVNEYIMKGRYVTFVVNEGKVCHML